MSGHPYHHCGFATPAGDVVGGDPIPLNGFLYAALGCVKVIDGHSQHRLLTGLLMPEDHV